MICFSQDNLIIYAGSSQPDLPGMEGYEDFKDWNVYDIAEYLFESNVPIYIISQRLASMGYKSSIVDLYDLGKFVVVEDKIFDDNGYGRDISDFLWGLSSNDLDLYSECIDADINEWENVGLAYHGTPVENAESIEANGIEARNESRGTTNAWTGAAVFMSENINQVDSHGGAIFEIDLDSMKRDGYTPHLQREDSISEGRIRTMIGREIGLDDIKLEEYSGQHSWDGIFNDTLVLYGDIPRKYIKRIV
jgi:hypothetical protein